MSDNLYSSRNEDEPWTGHLDSVDISRARLFSKKSGGLISSACVKKPSLLPQRVCLRSLLVRYDL